MIFSSLILNNLILTAGIIFPNPFGYLAILLIFTKNLFIKITKAFLINSKYKLTTLLSLLFILLHLLIPLINGQFIINPEIKTLFFFLVSISLIINKKPVHNIENLNKVFTVIICYSFLAFIYSIIFNGKILRFTDDLIIFRRAQWTSVYFGSFFVVVYAITKSKFHQISSFLLIIFSGSGTALFGFLFLIWNRNIKYFKSHITRLLINRRLILLFFVFIFAILALLISQIDRNRNIFNLESIDRYVIQTTYIKYYIENFSISKFILGNGFFHDIREFASYINDPIVRGYVTTKLSNSAGAAILHSEHLRILNNFGLIGYLIFIRQIFIMIDKDKLIFSTLLLMGLFSSICYTNSIFLLLITLNNYKISNSNR